MGIGYEEIAILSFLIAAYVLTKPICQKWLFLVKSLLALAAVFIMLISTLSAIFRRFNSLKSTS